MSDTQNLPTPQPTQPRKKMWAFFAVFFIFALVMYGSTMYRIRTSGFLGQGKTMLAHPEDANPDAPGYEVAPTSTPAPAAQ